jgi:AraC-like DNA-binding protein
VGAASYLVLNAGRTYSMEIRSQSVVETFCVFFHPSLVADVLRSRLDTPNHLLDNPLHLSTLSCEFFEHMRPHDDIVTPALRRLYSTIGNAEPVETEESLHFLLDGLLNEHHHAYSNTERIPAVSCAARKEIYRRLHYARDYMDASFGQPVTLEQVAAVACMSRHHFLRLFKQVFTLTPHQYLTRIRLARAKSLLLTTELPVYAVGLEIGLQSTEWFVRLFHTRFGLTPAAFRYLNRSNK